MEERRGGGGREGGEGRGKWRRERGRRGEREVEERREGSGGEREVEERGKWRRGEREEGEVGGGERGRRGGEREREDV